VKKIQNNRLNIIFIIFKLVSGLLLPAKKNWAKLI